MGPGPLCSQGTAERGHTHPELLARHCCWAVPALGRCLCCQGSWPPQTLLFHHRATAPSLPLPTGTRPERAGPRLLLHAHVSAGNSPQSAGTPVPVGDRDGAVVVQRLRQLGQRAWAG